MYHWYDDQILSVCFHVRLCLSSLDKLCDSLCVWMDDWIHNVYVDGLMDTQCVCVWMNDWKWRNTNNPVISPQNYFH